MYRVLLLLPAVLLATAACDPEPTTPLRPDPFLHAQVTRAVTIEHRGGAVFGGGTRSDTQRAKLISSYDGERDARIGFQLLRSERVPFETGSYPLSPRNWAAGDNEGNTAIYLLPGSRRYVAESGTLRITEVSAKRVDGEFEFTAVYWCTPHENREACYTLPEEFAADAPRVDVTGTFSAEASSPVPRGPDARNPRTD